MPTGRLNQIAQVEMPRDGGGDYLPDRSDAQLMGITINNVSGVAGVSNHATLVGQYCMGLSGSAGPGVRLIDSYEANNWAGSGLLMVNSNQPPRTETQRSRTTAGLGRSAPTASILTPSGGWIGWWSAMASSSLRV